MSFLTRAALPALAVLAGAGFLLVRGVRRQYAASLPAGVLLPVLLLAGYLVLLRFITSM